MSRYVRIRLLLAAAVLAIAAAVWGVGRLEGSADTNSTRALDDAQQMLISMLDQETGLRGYTITHADGFLGPYREGRQKFETALADARRHSAAYPDDLRRLANSAALAHRWELLAQQQLAQIQRNRQPTPRGARLRKDIMDQYRAANAAIVADKQRDRTREQNFARMLGMAVIVGLGVIFAFVGWLTVERPARRDAERRRRLAEFGDALQVARTEREAFDVLRRHLEGWLQHARAVVLIRNSSANRLQAATGLEHTPVLASKLEGATPESCLAIRLAKPYHRAPGEHSLLECEVCGQLPECSACAPTIVGGTVIGSVLVQTPDPVRAHDDEDLTASVGAAGPVIANLRNLAIAEMRAATDALTGLANHRAVQDTLNRMVAQAGRTKTPLACVMFDLDHFKQVNDLFGHAKGDEVLASVGAAVAGTVRESDFVGRYGGEEFIALLPDTDLEGARVLAEKLRAAIGEIVVPELDRGVTASFGVAALPRNGVTGEQLSRAADRALYAAKRGGRNRVHVVESNEPRHEPAEAH